MFQNESFSKGMRLPAWVIGLLLCAGVSQAQQKEEVEGFEWGWLYFRPEAGAEVAHDSRVVILPDGTAEGDVYSEAYVGVRINNRPARYGLAVEASYGQRYYADHQALDDDFYDIGGVLVSDQQRLNWKLSTFYTKELNYNTQYNPDTGRQPDSILSDIPSKRFVARGSVSYEATMGERLSLVPSYALLYYNHEFLSDTTEEWLINRINLPLRFAYSGKTYLSIGGAASLQTGKEEDGRIGTLYAGVQSRATEKTQYDVKLGMSAADYDESGTRVSGVSDVRLLWEATQKVTTYVFGGNRYQPGYGGGAARMVYRAGYGADWLFARQWRLSGQGLHNYEDELSSGTGSSSYGGVDHFFTARVVYALPRLAEIAWVGRYVNDDADKDQVIVSIRVDFYY